MESQRSEVVEVSPEERMLEAASSLGAWEQSAIARLGLRGVLSFDRGTREPDFMLRTILNCAKEIRDARAAVENPLDQPVSEG